SSAGLALGAPALPDDDAAALTEELDRREAGWVLTVGDVALPEELGDVVAVPAPADDAALAEHLDLPAGEPVDVGDGEEVAAVVGLERGTLTPLAPAAGAADDADEGTADDETAEQTTAPEAESEPAADGEELPATELPEPVTGTLALTTGVPEELLATATARAAGADVAVVPGGDPRATSESVTALSEAAPKHVVGL